MIQRDTRQYICTKGYQGTDSSEFMNNLRYYKLIKVDEDGGVDKLELHIPIEAKNSHLKDLKMTSIGQEWAWMYQQKLGNSSGVALSLSLIIRPKSRYQ